MSIFAMGQLWQVKPVSICWYILSYNKNSQKWGQKSQQYYMAFSLEAAKLPDFKFWGPKKDEKWYGRPN